MSILDAAAIALRAIGGNRLRSGLTALGLIIGVSSVIVLIAVGQGTQKGITDQIQGLGTDLVFIEPGTSTDTATGTQGGPGSANTLVLSDVDAIAAAGVPGVTDLAGELTLEAQLVAGAENVGATIVGTTAEWPFVRDAAVASGAFFSSTDVTESELTIVLGATAASELFGEADPIGESVRISLAGGRVTFEFTVVGVMLARGGADGSEFDAQAYVPVTSLLSRLQFLRGSGGDVPVSQITVKTTPGTDQELTKQLISDVLLFKHGVAEADFTIQSQDDLISAASSVSNTLSLLLGSIAGISLVVGGIGVMNIMLVSVTERTREIGIRRAVGAQASDIVKQFVTEALLLCTAGGVVGIVLGVGISIGLGGREVGGQEMTTVVQLWSIVLAFAVAAGVGLVSGIYPAVRATSVDPIAALRNE
ncbi:MAG: ABC transporter permease [Chloroflexi bacterium]|nr:ABC transporter permease [Chloroflexota bacterium]MDA1147964.1 ABC transporter permease [Chloroflexota bacterium]